MQVVLNYILKKDISVQGEYICIGILDLWGPKMAEK